MSPKYIVTVKTDQGNEIVCKLGNPKRDVGTMAEVKSFLDNWAKKFPGSTYHIYELREVE